MKKSHVLIVGDFNYRHVNWDTCETTEGALQPTGMFLNSINACFLSAGFRVNTFYRGARAINIGSYSDKEENRISNVCY